MGIGAFIQIIIPFFYTTALLLITLLDKGVARGENSEGHGGRNTQYFKSSCKCRRN